MRRKQKTEAEFTNESSWARVISSLVGPELGIVSLTYIITGKTIQEPALLLAIGGIILLAAIRGIIIWKQLVLDVNAVNRAIENKH